MGRMAGRKGRGTIWLEADSSRLIEGGPYAVHPRSRATVASISRRAIESRRAVARAVNMGISAIIDADGARTVRPFPDERVDLLGKMSNSLVGNAGLVSKIFFPRLVLPFSTLGSTKPARAASC